MEVKFGSVAKDYARWRNDFPVEVFKQLESFGVRWEGRKIVDLGCGTGVLSRELVKRGAQVTGVDPSPELLAEARKGEEGSRICYICATAENSTLPSAQYEMVTVLRAWHWFNRPQAIKEVKRILKEGGLFIVMDSRFDLSKQNPLLRDTFVMAKSFLPKDAVDKPGSRKEEKERLLGFPLSWFSEWEKAGLRLTAGWEWEYSIAFSHEYWLGRIRTLSWYTLLSEAQKREISDRLQELLAIRYPDEPISVPHVCSVAVLKYL
ncbi:class I SAM-dependent methyltransferase [Thermoactinomyces sp. CICC 10522]|uniref:class I SAM-dependent methyltransferase n=1 Tax=Thermoactinomyces sp. CICC 10522 TaxID=2767427 RepID=UPI0018DC17DD|nr:class I SAM-dependent methyltransferase [Thermoactinomyces sp. CICC 10522]MBH8604465.1 class I SAM-dependent methyltransferase [Thermoactinomyces sp. CICC 10522]